MHLLYVLENFPSKTEYFILREIQALERQGFVINILAFGSQGNLSDHHNYSLSKVYYSSLRKSCTANFYFFKKKPINYLNELFKLFLESSHRFYEYPIKIKNYLLAIGCLYRIRYIQIDHIHAHFAFLPTKIAVHLSRFLNVPFSFTAHAQDIYANDKRSLANEIGQAKFVVTCTKYNCSFLQKLVPDAKNRIHHVYHGIDLSQWNYSSRKGISKKRPIRILLIARLTEKKGIQYLLTALLEFQKKYPLVQCTIIGEGVLERDIRRFISINQMQKTISLEGFKPQSDLQQYYNDADIFVLPSIISQNGDQDGLPNVLLECLATGLPIISTNISAIPELISPGKTGILVKPKDVSGIVDNLKLLVEDSNLYQRMSENGRILVESHFDLKSCTQELSRTFKTYNTKV